MSQTSHNPVPNFFRAAAADFKKIPGSPIAYWFSNNAVQNFTSFKTLGDLQQPKSGMSSCNSDLFLRQWFEVRFNSLNKLAKSHQDAGESTAKWYPYNKGGGNRKWFGYNETVINWENEGEEIKNFVVNNPKDPNTTHWSRRLFNLEFFFQPGITWSAITSSRLSGRIVENGVIPGTGSKTIYNLNDNSKKIIVSLLNSEIAEYYLAVFSPTLNFEAGDVAKLPVTISIEGEKLNIDKLFESSKSDWDAYETSWDFTVLPLLHPDYRRETLAATYAALRQRWQEMTNEMQQLEQENNRIFIAAYGLQEELTPEVPLNEITLTCNPHYRYGNGKSAAELESLLQADTIRELLSYGVGCLFGRYSLDTPGLILANQGETRADYLAKIPNPTLAPDEDNIIPLLEDDYFADDLVTRLKQFLRLSFGEAHYPANLRFVEQALGKELRSYLVKDFYNDHVRRYKKRPIYWLFQSPGKGFSALIYLHRYRSDTVSRLLNGYVREYQVKLIARLRQVQDILNSVSADKAEQKRADKERVRIEKLLRDLSDYEQRLHHLAVQKIEIDLDDGVKVNYGKFDGVVAGISGLRDEE